MICKQKQNHLLIKQMGKEIFDKLNPEPIWEKNSKKVCESVNSTIYIHKHMHAKIESNRKKKRFVIRSKISKRTSFIL